MKALRIIHPKLWNRPPRTRGIRGTQTHAFARAFDRVFPKFAGGVNNKLHKSNPRLLISFLLFVLAIFSTYAFFAHEVSKVDVSGPGPGGPVIVPENYQNLLVLDVTIPPYDAGRVQEDIKLHNGVAGSSPRDILYKFSPTSWYSDHDGDVSFDGNLVSGNTEAIVLSSDDTLDSGDTVEKSGLCLIKTFAFSSGIGEQYIDSNRSQNYNTGEAVVRTSVSGEIQPGEVIRSGTADMTSFPQNIRFTDGINGNLSPARYDDGEAILSSSDGVLNADDTVLTPGNADLNPFPVNVVYTDFDGNGKYGSAEAVLTDNGVPGQLDSGRLDGTGVDRVIRAGKANLKSMSSMGLLFADDNGDNLFTPDELIVASQDMNVDAGEVRLSGSANLKVMVNLSFADDNNDGQLGTSELIIKNTGVYANILEATDTIISAGAAGLKSFISGVELFVDNDNDNVYGDGECIVRDNGNGTVEPGDVEKPGLALLQPFSGRDYLFTDDNSDGEYTGDTNLTDGYHGEAIFKDSNSNGLVDNGELVTAGYAALRSFPSNLRYVDAGDPTPGDGVYSNNEAIVMSSDGLLSSSDTIVRSGPAFLKAFGVNVKWADVDQDDQYDDGELIVESQDNTLSQGEVAKPGYCNLRSLASDYAGRLYSDNNGNDVYSTDELVIYSTDTMLDAGDSVSKPGKSCLLSLKNQSFTRYIDNSGNRDFNSEEAIVSDLDGDPLLAESILDVGDRVIRTQPGVVDIKSLGDNVVYIDHNGDGYFKGDSDNDVTWGQSQYYANDPSIIADQDEVLLDDPAGPNHLALDSGDVVLRPGLALLTNFSDSVVYTDDGDWEYDGYDGSQPNEAIIQDNNANLSLESTDRVIVTGRALIRDFSPPGTERYIDTNENGQYTPGEAIIIDSSPGGSANGLLDAGALDGTGIDQVINPGTAKMRRFNRAEKFADGNRNGAYDMGEAVVYDWYEFGTFVGEFILAGDPRLPTPTGFLNYQPPGSRYGDSILLASQPNLAAMVQLNHRQEHKYVDRNHSGICEGFYFGTYDPILWTANSDLDEGNLDGTGTDRVLACGYANVRFWPENLKWADSNHNGQYQKNEAIAYDAGNDNIITSIGTYPSKDQIMVPGEADLRDFANLKYVDANYDNDFDDGELMISDINQDNMIQNEEIGNPGLVPADLLHPFASSYYKYCDPDRDNAFDPQEAIVMDLATPGILEAADMVMSAGYAGLTAFSPLNMFVDYNHSGTYDANEAIIYGDGDQMIEGSDQIIVSGAASSFDSTSFKYAAATVGSPYSNGWLIARDANVDNILTGNEIVTSGAALLRNFKASTDRYADSDHNNRYDYNDIGGFGEAIIVNTTGNADKVESSDEIKTSGYADLQSFNGTDYRHSDANRNNEYTDGELIVNDLDSDNKVDSGEIVRAGLAGLRQFAADVMYIDSNRDNLYSSAEAIIRTADADLGGDDEVLSAGAAGLRSFEANIYRFTDADHDDLYDAGEAIVVEVGWGAVDDILEDSDIVVLEGIADIEQFLPNFMFLDDSTNSNAYEDGEAIVNDSNSNSLLDPGEIITGGRASLWKFASGERYTDGGQGPNARNLRYDQDEAIIRDGTQNGTLDTGPLNGTGNDAVLAPGKAGLMGFRDDERYADKNGNGKYDGGQYNSEDIYLDRDRNGIVTAGQDALEYFVVENNGTATNADLIAVKLWADKDKDGQFEPNTGDAPAVAALAADASKPKIWYQGPATAPPLSAPSSQPFINYSIPTNGQRFFVSVDIISTPTDGRDVRMGLPLNGVKTVFGPASPTDTAVVNAYTQKIDFANPHVAQITSPMAGAVLNGQIILRADAADTIQVGKVEFYSGPPGGSNTPIAVDDDGAPWEAYWDTGGFAYGPYTLYARVYDRTYLMPTQTWGIKHYKDSQGVPVTLAISFAVQLYGGWNLVSVPVEAFNTSINSVLSSINGNYTAVWTYDATRSKWLRYDLEGPGFLNDLSAIHIGIGYWILMSGPGTLRVDGARSNTGIQLKSGWNLVGCNSLTPLNIATATASIENVLVWTYDAETGRWLSYDPRESTNDLNTMKPGSAYWIYTTRSCIWDVGSQ